MTSTTTTLTPAYGLILQVMAGHYTSEIAGLSLLLQMTQFLQMQVLSPQVVTHCAEVTFLPNSLSIKLMEMKMRLALDRAGMMQFLILGHGRLTAAT